MRHARYCRDWSSDVCFSDPGPANVGRTMAKKRGVKTAAPAGENPRRPCPCGSGKRYKACHGAGDDVIVPRPFAGLAAECELVALREFLPSATAPLPLRDGGSATDRKSTRLNSSHANISYAVFCL